METNSLGKSWLSTIEYIHVQSLDLNFFYDLIKLWLRVRIGSLHRVCWCCWFGVGKMARGIHWFGRWYSLDGGGFGIVPRVHRRISWWFNARRLMNSMDVGEVSVCRICICGSSNYLDFMALLCWWILSLHTPHPASPPRMCWNTIMIDYLRSCRF